MIRRALTRGQHANWDPVIWTSTGNAQVGAVVLHNVGTEIGMYGNISHYRVGIDSTHGGQWHLP